jgi:uncharacterized MnhB-related membrane protein
MLLWSVQSVFIKDRLNALVILIMLSECTAHYVTVNPKPSCMITRGFGMV